jgi:hypothetical protein
VEIVVFLLCCAALGVYFLVDRAASRRELAFWVILTALLLNGMAAAFGRAATY